MSTLQIVSKAIEESIRHNCIATIRTSETDVSAVAIHDALQAECEDSVRNGGVYEFWGRNLDGNIWRVHVIGVGQ